MEKCELIAIAADHHKVHTEITINTPCHTVWAVLTDFETMPNWSPSFKGVSGDFSHGANVTTTFDMGQGNEAYTATLILTDGVEYGWSENYDGIRDHHLYRVDPMPAGHTRFSQTDEFKGTADWATTADLANLYLEQYKTFNRALKAACERR